MSFLFYFKNHTELKWMIYNFGIYNKLFNNILDMKDFKFLDQIIDEYKNINIYNVFIMNFNDEDILELIKYKNIMKYLNESKIHILVKSINMIDILYKRLPTAPWPGACPPRSSAPSAPSPASLASHSTLTFDPPWSKDRMSQAAKLALGIDDLIPIARLPR